MSGLYGPSIASQVSFVPVGTIAATNVQTMGEELDNEKVAKAGDTMTGDLLGTRFSVLQDAFLSGSANGAFACVLTSAGMASFTRITNGTGSANIYYSRARGAVGAPTALINGDALGSFIFNGYDGTTALERAFFGAVVDGAVSTGVMPLAIRISTGSNGAPTERFRIDSSGNLQMGGTNTVIDNNRHIVFRRYTVGTVPSAASNAGRGVMVTPTAGNERLYTSNGTNWYDGAGVILS